MFSLSSCMQYYYYRQSCDMRKSFDSLSGIVKSQMQRDPLSGEVYIFINKRRNRIKLLHWEQGGFVLYYKRLEKGTIELPANKTGSLSYQLYWTELVMMIEGISIEKTKKRKRYL